MCIVFTCGEHTFRKEVEGYNGLVCRCYNCGNYSGSVVKSNPWFTFCFITSCDDLDATPGYQDGERARRMAQKRRWGLYGDIDGLVLVELFTVYAMGTASWGRLPTMAFFAANGAGRGRNGRML
ncbi:uncharacterized protein B0H64DRAFT_369428 [Chaetomium fimeti]|uniref:Uncharacterized protein n=1 Tax=Chaetomium fimeti TaxID=1854472 RepID=A0AAE0HP42_9PEZI|nr:hypothetical protein B0H64DRAFT_369428 [Chaetomium fimeti]